MPVTKTDIANMALSHVGISDRIALITDRNARARACLLFYDNVLEQSLRDYDWPFARRYATLALVATLATDGTAEWVYSFRAPADMLAARRVVNGLNTRIETNLSRIPFTVLGDAQGGLIYTDHQAPTVLRYTALVTDTSRFPPDFAQAMALLLAGHIAPELSKGDELKLGERALQKYDWRVRRAWANAANEEQVDAEGDSRFVTERN